MVEEPAPPPPRYEPEPARSSAGAVGPGRVADLESQIGELKAGLARRHNETRANRLKALEEELRVARGY